jgi:hypothetical protein
MKILKRLALVTSVIINVVLLYVIMAFSQSYRDMKNSFDIVSEDNIALQKIEIKTKFDALQWKNYTDRIDTIMDAGYKPDSLLVACIMKEMYRFPGLDWSFINDVAQKESSWGRNKADGMIGEKGWSQIRPETLAYFINMLGGDTTGINYDDYKNIRTATEWSFRIFFYAKMNLKNEITHKDWNTGTFIKKGK